MCLRGGQAGGAWSRRLCRALTVAKRLGRLTSTQYRMAYREGKRYADALLILYIRQNGLSTPRVGVSVSKRFGGAVLRNRLKRQLREACWRSRALLASGLDLILIPRRGVEAATVAALEMSIRKLVVGAGLLGAPSASLADPRSTRAEPP